MPLADQVSAIVFDDSSTPAGRARLRVELDGAPLGQRMISTTLKLRAGGNRHLLLVGLPAARIARSRVALAVGREFVAAIDPEWLQSPLADSGALIEGLSDQGRRRLLKLFLTTGSSLFRLDAADEFGAAVQPPARPARPSGADARVLVSGRRRRAAFHLPRADHPRHGGHRLAGRAWPGRPHPAADRLPAATERGERGGLLHVFLPRAVPAGTTLFGFGETPVQLRTPDAEGGAARHRAVAGAARRVDPGLGAGSGRGRCSGRSARRRAAARDHPRRRADAA